MVVGPRPVSESASHVRPLRSLAMVLAATAGPIQVTTANASEKKVWNSATPTLAGSALTLATPPTAQIRSAIRPVITARMIGVRPRRAAWRISRIQIGLGSFFRFSTRMRARSMRRDDGGASARVGRPVCALIAGPPG